MTEPGGEITQFLKAWSDGRPEALDELIPRVQAELRGVARGYLRRERGDHTLQPTALVHEAYFRLIDQKQVRWQDRAHFFGIAAQMMRRILVDHARKKRAEKRGGDVTIVPLDEAIDAAKGKDMDLIALDDALGRLAELDPRQARVVELRHFGGLSVEETGHVLDISPATVKREWATAKAWLFRELRRG